MSERTLKEILFTADGIKDKPMETDEHCELLYNKAAAERDKLKAQRDALLAAAKNICATLRAYQLVLVAAQGKPFSIPDFVILDFEKAIQEAKK